LKGCIESGIVSALYYQRPRGCSDDIASHLLDLPADFDVDPLAFGCEVQRRRESQVRPATYVCVNHGFDLVEKAMDGDAFLHGYRVGLDIVIYAFLTSRFTLYLTQQGCSITRIHCMNDIP
jgi:hypothetical protein